MQEINDPQLWLEEKNDQYQIGLTAQAQDDFGEISFISLPKKGEKLLKDESFAEVESEKSVTELLSPIDGVVAAVNSAAVENPALLSSTNKEENWLVTVEKNA